MSGLNEWVWGGREGGRLGVGGKGWQWRVGLLVVVVMGVGGNGWRRWCRECTLKAGGGGGGVGG